MQIVASTGHWLDPSNTMRARTVEELVDFFTREITVGIEGTDIKAGIIKVANGGTIEPFGEKVLRAAARVSKATGLPVTTHSPGAQRIGEKQAAIFEEEGLAPARVCIGHTDNSPGDYQMGLARRGYYLGMDQLPRGGPAPPGTPMQAPGALTWQQRYTQIKALVDAGFANRLMLGNDHSLGMTLQPTAADSLRVAQNPDGMLFVVRKAIPALKQLGVSDQAIRTMTVDVPRNFFERVT
jgi:phosphotriesterase-related protein